MLCDSLLAVTEDIGGLIIPLHVSYDSLVAVSEDIGDNTPKGVI